MVDGLNLKPETSNLEPPFALNTRRTSGIILHPSPTPPLHPARYVLL